MVDGATCVRIKVRQPRQRVLPVLGYRPHLPSLSKPSLATVAVRFGEPRFQAGRPIVYRNIGVCPAARGEEVRDDVVVERQPGPAEVAVSVGPEIQSACCQRRLELCHPVAAIAERVDDRCEVSHEVDADRGVGGQPLIQREVARLAATLAGPQALEFAPGRMVLVGPRLEAVDAVDDEEGATNDSGGSSAKRLSIATPRTARSSTVDSFRKLIGSRSYSRQEPPRRRIVSWSGRLEAVS